jgi:hypothetical protein
MKIQSFMVALLLGGMSLSASAASVSAGVGSSVLAFTPGDTGNSGDGGLIAGWGWHENTISYPFSVTRPIEVTALANYSMFVASHVHLVTITDSAAPSVVLASAAVGSGGSVDQVSVNVAFAYAPITPVLLTPGHVYTMSSSQVNDLANPGYDFYYSVYVFSPAPEVTTTYTTLQVAGDFYYKLPPTKNDFGGNGKSDILFTNTSTGVTRYWSDAAKTQSIYVGTYSLNYAYQSSGDFDGDGKADLLFVNTSTNATLIWPGAVKTAASYPGAGAAGFNVAAICDTDGDGKDDIVWFNPTTGSTRIWPGASKAAITYPGIQNTAYSIVACADFDGDGKADIFWRNATTGADQVWLGGQKSSMMYPGANTDLTWKPVGAGDINGDNHSDLVWYSPSTGAVRVWLGGMKANSTYIGTNATTFTPQAVGDYDGDGKADLLWSNDTSLATQIWPAFNKANATYPGTYPAGFVIWN